MHACLQVRCVWVNSACASRFVPDGFAATQRAARPLAGRDGSSGGGGRGMGTAAAATAASMMITAAAASTVASMINRSAAGRWALCGLLRRVAGRNGAPIKTWDM